MYFVLGLVALFILLQPFSNELMFNPGHPLTWLTAHFVHLSYQHILLNAFGLIVYVFVKENKIEYKKTTVHILVASILISFGLFLDNYPWYVGFSGVLHTLFVLAFWQERKNWFGQVGLAVVFSKIVFENIHHSTAYEQFLGGHIATPAHLCGVVAALLIIATEEGWLKLSKNFQFNAPAIKFFKKI